MCDSKNVKGKIPTIKTIAGDKILRDRKFMGDKNKQMRFSDLT